MPNDPSEVKAGGVRFRSIQYAKSIHDILDGAFLTKAPKSEGSTVALVEVVGMSKLLRTGRGNCTNFGATTLSSLSSNSMSELTLI